MGKLHEIVNRTVTTPEETAKKESEIFHEILRAATESGDGELVTRAAQAIVGNTEAQIDLIMLASKFMA